MPLFSYKAKNISGELVSAIMEAENIKSVSGKLESLGYFPLSILPYKNNTFISRYSGLVFKKNISHKDMTLFTRRLADSLVGGLSLERALKVIEKQTDNGELSLVIKEIILQIQEGRSLSQALNRYPVYFSKMYIAMISAGETAGALDVVLARLAEFNEKEEEIRYKIFSALAYPVVMLFVGIISITFLLGFVIPKFEVMFSDLGNTLPFSTKILISSSRLLRFWWWLYIPVFLAVLLFAIKSLKSERGKLFFSDLKIKIPVIGPFIRKDLISRFIRTLSLLLKNGVPVLDALEIAKGSMDNRLFSAEIENIYKSVKEGSGLSRPMTQSKLFPSMVSEMISVGEETGNLESSLSRIAELYEREVEYAVKTMISLLEPVIIFIAGIFVCFIALSMLLPVFQLSSGFR